MNSIIKYRLFLFVFPLVFALLQTSAQVTSVNNYLSKVQNEVNQVNQLAGNQKVYEAISQLNETRRDLDRYVTYYLEDEMRKAKAENSGFSPSLNVSFSGVLTAANWENKVQQAQRSIKLAKEAFSDSHYQRTLDSQDEVWSYLKTVYGIGKTIKDVIENVEQAKFYDAIKGAKEGIDDFIENYKGIEEARLQIINTELYVTEIKGLIRRGERMEEKCWQFASFMRAYEQDVTDFYQVVNRFNQKINEIRDEVSVEFSSPDFSWNAQKYLSQINAAANQFKAGNGNYESIKTQIETINERAEADKDKISQNLYNSGANNAFEKVNQLEEDFNEFYDLSIDVMDDCYRFDQNRDKAMAQTTSEISTQSNQTTTGYDATKISGTESGSASPGSNLENTLYHNYWDYGSVWSGSFIQNGNSVEIEGVGTGLISGGVLYYKYVESDGTPRTDVYRLTGNGYSMEVLKEWSNDMIKQEWKDNTSVEPTEQNIKDRRATKGKYLKSNLKYAGHKKAALQDSDGDQVADKYDKCPNTPKGLTVAGRGVDIAGCPTGQYTEPNITATNNQQTENYNTDTFSSAVANNSGSNAGTSSVKSNISGKSSALPGKRTPNKLFHGNWTTSSNWMKLKQTGNTVEIDGKQTGQITNGILIYSYNEKDGTPRKDEYLLLDDGYSMQVKREITNQKIITDYAFTGITTNPTPEQFADYRAKKGTHIIKTYYYKGEFTGSKNDTDGDLVSDEYDNCPNSPAGLTVDNGGVDIAGCPTGQSVSSNTSTANASGSNNKQAANSSSNFEQTSNSNISNSAKTSVANTANVFAGTGTVSKTSATPSNSSSQTTTSQTNSKKEAEKISSAVNKMPRTGASSMARIPVYKLMENDKLVFRQTGGSFLKFYVRWVGVNFSEVLYDETKQIVFSTSELMAKRPEKAMYIDFQVNQYSDIHCYMEGWVFPQGVPIPAEWNIKDNSGSTVNNNGGNNFYELIKKADEAFNKKYWEETQGVRSSSNPKQESFDLLRKAESLISQEQNIENRYSMVLMLASKYAEYAKRVFVNSAKNDFIQSCGGLLGKFGNAASSIQETKTKSTAYNKIADGWRELTRAAMWGSHQYNKAACDIEVKRYYDLALREDRNNTQLQKTVEKINAPKKPVPAAVAATKPIPESSWAKAENLRNMMVENIPIEKEDGPHYLEVGLMKIDMGSINTGSGKVWVQRMGSADWELLTKSDEYIFPGDKIKTDEDAKNVSFNYSADKTNLSILPGSVVTFEEHQLYIERGNVHVRVVKSGNEFLIITPKATTGCRGTEFTVKVDNSGATDVHLYEGVIEMRNSTDISYLIPGQTATVKKDDEAIRVEEFNIQQHKQQYLSNQNQLNTTNNSSPFRFVTGGGKIIGGN